MSQRMRNCLLLQMASLLTLAAGPTGPPPILLCMPGPIGPSFLPWPQPPTGPSRGPPPWGWSSQLGLCLIGPPPRPPRGCCFHCGPSMLGPLLPPQPVASLFMGSTSPQPLPPPWDGGSSPHPPPPPIRLGGGIWLPHGSLEPPIGIIRPPGPGTPPGGPLPPGGTPRFMLFGG